MRKLGWIVPSLLAVACSPGAPSHPSPPVRPTGVAAPAQSPPAAKEATVRAGWYMEHGGVATFQPCGQGSLRIEGAAIASEAQRFGVTDDNPVYVRLRGTVSGDRFEVASVEQFGSPEPVRDCPMSGTMTPGP